MSAIPADTTACPGARTRPAPRSAPALAAASLFMAASAVADSVQLVADRDATLIQPTADETANGAGSALFTGRVGASGGGTIRRGLLRFDVGAAIPAGSVVTGASLALVMVQGQAAVQGVSLHRVAAEWTEGLSASGGGGGVPPVAGDCTWTMRSWPDLLWSQAGGDFAAAPSATCAVGGTGTFVWSTTIALAADVQAWVDDPGANRGWLLRGNEAVAQTSKSFASREAEDPAVRPSLTVWFVPPGGVVGDLDRSGAVDGADLGLLLGGWGGSDPSLDLDGSGSVDGGDLGLLLGHWG